MEAAPEGDDPLATCEVAGQFERAFDGFRAAVGQEDLPAARVGSGWRNLHQPLAEFHIAGAVDIRPAHVNDAAGLFFDCLDHRRVAVTGGADGDASEKIEKSVAVYVCHPAALAALRHKGIDPAQRFAGDGLISGNIGRGFGAGQGGGDGNAVWA